MGARVCVRAGREGAGGLRREGKQGKGCLHEERLRVGQVNPARKIAKRCGPTLQDRCRASPAGKKEEDGRGGNSNGRFACANPRTHHKGNGGGEMDAARSWQKKNAEMNSTEI